MEVDFTKNFLKILDAIKSKDLLQKIEFAIENVMQASSISEINNLKN